MSAFLQRFHRLSSSKSNYSRDAIAFYQILVPVLARYPEMRKIHTHDINKNLQLKSVDKIKNDPMKKPLVVILPWLLAKDSHIEKFRKLYISRGFDVLTVNMSPKDVLFPVSGSQVIAKNLLDYFASHDHYEDIVIHAFSVGGYLMGEIFVEMRKDTEKCKDINSRIRGFILDSFVDFEGIQAGFSLSASKNPIITKFVEWYISTHLALMYNVATKHYLTSLKNLHSTLLTCPALVFVSEADKVGKVIYNQMLAENWQVRGVNVTLKCWKDSKHVCHLLKYQDEYVSEVDKFLSKVNLLHCKL